MAFPTIADGTESKQLARITDAPKKDGQNVVITYTRLDVTPNKEGQTARVFINGMPEDTKASLKALKAGDECVIVKVKKGEYWNFARIDAKSTFVAKAPFVPGQGGNKTGATKAPYDQVGAKVGGVLHDAVALATASKGADVTVNHVAYIARELLALSIQLEAETRADAFKDVTTKTTTEAQKASTKKEAEEASIFEDDNNDDY